MNIEQTRGREAAEYVHAMANLHSRAREHTELARHHHNRLKGGLARRRAVLADLPDEQFLSALAHTSPALTDEQLGDVRAILTGLADRPSEQQIVNLAAHIDHLLHTIR